MNRKRIQRVAVEIALLVYCAFAYIISSSGVILLSCLSGSLLVILSFENEKKLSLVGMVLLVMSLILLIYFLIK